MASSQIRVDAAELEAFLFENFPQSDRIFAVRRVNGEGLVLAATANPRHLRPGGTVSGPFLMMVADTAMYLVLLSRIGLVAGALTTDLQIRFSVGPTPVSFSRTPVC